jgi:glycosyltransferase involved in cell wall biosynthesis
MRVLIAHNEYQQPGGEDAVVRAEADLLRSRGHDVRLYLRHNDELRTTAPAAAALGTAWSRRTAREVDRILDEFRPDVVHAHNTFPLVSPALHWQAAGRGVPVVQTLHNFRLLCIQAMLLRDGRVCEDCVGRSAWRGVAHRCYRRSFAASAVAACALSAHRLAGTYRRKVSRYVALTEFARRKFVDGGLPDDLLSVKPNFVDLGPPAPQPRAGGLFVGRLAPEKGIGILAAAAAHAGGLPCRVAGVGPEEARVRSCPGLEALGWRTPGDVVGLMRRAEFLVFPSLWYEGCPRTIIEAFACGLPVIASRLGALAELVRHEVTGLLFEPGSADDLARAIAWAKAHPAALAEMGRRAREEYEAKYTPERNYRSLLAIYDQARSIAPGGGA